MASSRRLSLEMVSLHACCRRAWCCIDVCLRGGCPRRRVGGLCACVRAGVRASPMDGNTGSLLKGQAKHASLAAGDSFCHVGCVGACAWRDSSRECMALGGCWVQRVHTYHRTTPTTTTTRAGPRISVSSCSTPERKRTEQAPLHHLTLPTICGARHVSQVVHTRFTARPLPEGFHAGVHRKDDAAVARSVGWCRRVGAWCVCVRCKRPTGMLTMNE
jgi:hypothetical protein